MAILLLIIGNIIQLYYYCFQFSSYSHITTEYYYYYVVTLLPIISTPCCYITTDYWYHLLAGIKCVLTRHTCKVGIIADNICLVLIIMYFSNITSQILFWVVFYWSGKLYFARAMTCRHWELLISCNTISM